MNNKAGIALSAIVGFIVFSFAGGLHVLNVSNIGWLLNGDPAQHWIGWQFFRSTPLLQWPLGLNPSYGMELNNSIVFTDSIPIVALVLKYISPLLPDIMQYTGIWLMTVYLMQAISAYMLIEFLTKNKIYSILASVIFLTASAFMYRTTGHFALSAQWVIVMSLYFYLQPEMKWKSWGALVIFTSLVHAYLLAMCMTLLLVSVISRCVSDKNKLTSHLIKTTIIFILCILAMYIVGYFTVQNGINTKGYGFYKSNLNTFFNPMFPFGSRFLPVIPTGRADYEGFAYLGLGGIILAIASSVLSLVHLNAAINFIKKHWIIFIGFIGLTAFAVSGNVMMNAKTLVAIPVPEFLSPLTSAFRASGRFIWPVMYALLAFCLTITYRKLPRAAAYILLLACVTLQCMDSTGWFRFSRATFKGDYTSSYNFNSPLWIDAAKNGKYLVSLPRDYMGGDPVLWAHYAATHGMQMNFGYFARFNTKIWAELAERDNQRVESGNIDPKAVYIFADKGEFDRAVSQAKIPVETDESNGYHVMSAR